MTRTQALIGLRDKVKVGEWSFNLSATAFPPEHAYAKCTFMFADEAFGGSLDAAKALRIALGLPVPEKMHSEARLELLDILEALIAQEGDT